MEKMEDSSFAKCLNLSCRAKNPTSPLGFLEDLVVFRVFKSKISLPTPNSNMWKLTSL